MYDDINSDSSIIAPIWLEDSIEERANALWQATDDFKQIASNFGARRFTCVFRILRYAFTLYDNHNSVGKPLVFLLSFLVPNSNFLGTCNYSSNRPIYEFRHVSQAGTCSRCVKNRNSPYRI